MLADLFLAVRPRGRVVTITPEVAEASPAGLIARMRSPGETLYVLRDVDRLSPAAVEALVAALARNRARPASRRPPDPRGVAGVGTVRLARQRPGAGRRAHRCAAPATGGGRIEVGDLPASCQSSPGGELRTVDRVERDAIVAALRESRGNRVAAATALGLARSTLYRKIRQHGITT